METKRDPKKKSGSPMDAALRYLGSRARTVREVERHLDECQYGEVEVYETVQRLIELKLLDDRAYMADFIETRLNTKPVSRAHLREQLLAHEIDRDAVEEALAAVTEETETENAFAIAEKYMRQLSALPEDAREERVYKRVLSRGFSYETARAAIERFLNGEKPE